MSKILEYKPRLTIKAELKNGPGYFSFSCIACGESDDSDSPVRARIYNGGERPFVQYLDVCGWCLKAGPKGIKARIASHVVRLKQHIAELEELKTAKWELPTYAEYEEANRKFNEELAEQTK